jgi:hypothetical protein
MIYRIGRKVKGGKRKILRRETGEKKGRETDGGKNTVYMKEREREISYK